ncbi:MAG TPA: plasmid recombination protein [Flavobacterium sp.]|nr:plasmid recombination protein [Flavobacterium sp.]
MASSHLIRLGAIKGKQGVLDALKHNKRELQSERGASANIDVNRTPLNYPLAGNDSPANIATYAKVQMLKAGIETPRKNGVMAVEVIFSLPINRHSQDTKPFFMDCYEWVNKTFAGELLSFDVHLDEAAPHAHAVILPLIDGKMKGSELIGGKGNLLRLINLFHADIARHYGLSRPDRKRLTVSDRETLERNVLRRLRADNVMQSSVWPIVRDLIHKDPLPFAQLLSIQAGPAKQVSSKSFVQIMTSQGKGKTTNPI